MNLVKYFKQLEYKIIMLIPILMGLSGGYQIIHDETNTIAKLRFSFYGLIIGIIIGIISLALLNIWSASAQLKIRTIFIFVLFSIAPVTWVFFDFGTNVDTNNGALIMFAMNLVALILLVLFTWHEKRKLLPVLLIIPIWEFIMLFWCTIIFWHHLNWG